MNKKFLGLLLIALTVSSCMVAPSIEPTGFQGGLRQISTPETDFAVVKYLSGRELDPIEGAWVHDENTFEVVITKNDFDIETEFDYVGIITRFDRGMWKQGEVKLLLRKTESESMYTGDWITKDKTRQSMNFVVENQNKIQAKFVASDGETFFVRIRRK